VLGKFKEFDSTESVMSDWLSWGGLIKPGVLRNKDGGLMATLCYRYIKNIEDDKASLAIDELCTSLLELNGGWVIYSEAVNRSLNECVYYLTLFWLPKRDKSGKLKDLPSWTENLEVKDNGYAEEDAVQVFELVVSRLKESLGCICDVAAVEGVDYLNYLRSTITFDGLKVDMPKTPLFLDAFLSMDLTLGGELGMPVVSGYAMKIVSPLGYLGIRAKELIERLNECDVPYRFVSRFMFFDDEMIKKEEKRYFSKWCDGRKAMMPLLEYNHKKNSKCGYCTANIIVWDTDKKKTVAAAEMVEKVIQDMGICAVMEDYNLKDVWYGSVPGVVRANLKPPMVVVEDVSKLIVLPLKKEKQLVNSDE